MAVLPHTIGYNKGGIALVVILLRQLTERKSNSMPNELMRKSTTYAIQDERPAGVLKDTLVPFGN
jgi:hypothetical protein